MIGLLLVPGRQPEAVQEKNWHQGVPQRLLHQPGVVLQYQSFEAPGKQGGQMVLIYARNSTGLANLYAWSLVGSSLPADQQVRGPALVVRRSTRGLVGLSDQDCLALATHFVAGGQRMLTTGDD